MATGIARAASISIACGMVLAVSACGSDPESNPATDPPVVAIDVATTTTAPGAPTAPAPTSLAAAAPAGDLLLPGLPALDDPVRTYGWSADRRPTREDFQNLADALDVDGDVSEGIHGTGSGWSLDGDNLELTMDGGFEGAWSYSGPPPFPWPSEEEPWPTNETGQPVTIGPPATLPASGGPLPDNYPSQEEAQALAREIVASLGLDPEAFDWRNGQRNFLAEVEAWWVIDGGVSPVKLQFGFGPEGMLVHASGQLVTPQADPEVDRIGTTAAQERLRAEIERSRTQPLGLGYEVIGGFVVPGDPDAPIVLPEPGDPATAPPPTGGAPVHPTTAPPPTVPPEMVGRIVDVEASWQVVRDESGTRLLPAYTFVEATGMRYTVSAAP